MSNLYRILLIISVMLISACTSLPSDYKRAPSWALTDTSDTVLGKRAAEIQSEFPDGSYMYLMNEGIDAFVSRMSVLSLAEKSIDVQYYIWHADLIGKLLFNNILAAADRGVRVRILLDDINIKREVESIIYAMDQHENIEVHLFNPFAARSFHLKDYVLDGSRMNRRMHNKSFTVDNQITIVGGRNIGDEYFSAHEENNFVDFEVFSIGPVVKAIGKQFDIYWNSDVVFPVHAFDHNDATRDDLNKIRKELAEFKQSLQGSKYFLDIQDSDMYKRITDASYKEENPAKIFTGEVNVVYDDPEKSLGKSKEEVVYLISLMRPYLENTAGTFEMISPYFVPGSEGTEYLSGLVNKGIKVRVITNSLSSTDSILAQSGYSRQRTELLKAGVELYELKADSKTKASKSLRRSEKAKSGLHSKIYIFDRKAIFIGSFNFDKRSANINSEVGIVYEVLEMADLIAVTVFDEKLSEETFKVEFADEDQDEIVWVEMKEGKEIRHTNDPETSWWRRFNENIYSILPIESQL